MGENEVKSTLGSGDDWQRPKFHITVPYWMNDPCAPGYDHTTGFYHLFYQCNPHSSEWGNMSWGHVISKNLVHWTFAWNPVALKPDRKYDQDGIFTGCMGLSKSNKLTVFYSSVARLPFHWSTTPYPRGAAGLSAATSTDGGETWVKYEGNPIIREEPQGLEVSGFRDPYIAEWQAMDRLRGTERSLYGLISGGIRGQGPTTFLYACHPDDELNWVYLGPLVDLPSRLQPSLKWNSNYGINWECTNFMTLTSPSGSTAQHFLILGSEGDRERSHIKDFDLPPDLPARTIRSQQWLAGGLARHPATGQTRLEYKYGGLLDHGSYYAANSFHDPKTQRRIVFGWIPEEDLPVTSAKRKGWNGCQALPREVYLLSISNVVGALQSRLEDISCIDLERSPAEAGSLTIHTLGVRPLSELALLCDKAIVRQEFRDIALPTNATQSQHVMQLRTTNFRLTATIRLNTSMCSSVGLHLRHSSDFSTRTTLTFSLSNEQITVDRFHSTTNQSINKCPEQGPFTLFTVCNPHSGLEELEVLTLSVFGDGDILEVFANDRFALATMVYTEGLKKYGNISLFAEGGRGAAVFEDVTVWDGLNEGQSVIGGRAAV